MALCTDSQCEANPSSSITILPPHPRFPHLLRPRLPCPLLHASLPVSHPIESVSIFLLLVLEAAMFSIGLEEQGSLLMHRT